MVNVFPTMWSFSTSMSLEWVLWIFFKGTDRIILIWLEKEIKVEEVEWPSLDHTCSKWQNQDFIFPGLIHISNILSSVSSIAIIILTIAKVYIKTILYLIRELGCSFWKHRIYSEAVECLGYSLFLLLLSLLFKKLCFSNNIWDPVVCFSIKLHHYFEVI